MSTVFLHIGQCGNQVGYQFWNNASKDQLLYDSLSFFTHDKKQRSVHVDSEPKVIQQLTKTLPVRSQNVVCGKRGRGTNWALGYHGIQSGMEDYVLENSLEAVRKEVERSDRFMGLILMHSLSGGTGAGLGSRLLEKLRDEYPMNWLMSTTFAPCASGESPLQHYNSLLTLSWLQRYADSVILLYNDEILARLQKKSQKSVSFDAVNKLMANHLCGVFLPTDSLRSKNGVSVGVEPWEMQRFLCPMPSTKFIHLLYQAKSQLSWEQLAGQTLHCLHRKNGQGESFKSIANLVVARGDTTFSFPKAMTQGVAKRVKSAYNCVPWNPDSLQAWTAYSNHLGTKGSASITVAANYSNVVDYLETVCQRSKVMYDAGAYLHWYWRHGASKDLFAEALETVSQVVEDYKMAVK